MKHARRRPRRPWAWWGGGLVMALAMGMILGSVLYLAAPRLGFTSGRLALSQPRMGQHPPAVTSTGSPTPGAAAADQTALLQQFASALTSSDAQPLDIQSGLRLIIPSIKVNAPIVERGVVGGVMVVAPGNNVTHFAYSAYPGAPGNAVLYSHDGTVFRHLDKLAVGDTMLVQTPGGAAQFRVRELRIVSPDSVGILDTTSTAVLTLLTCFPYGVDTARLVVIADRVA